jgi:hypothetical protein
LSNRKMNRIDCAACVPPMNMEINKNRRTLTALRIQQKV